MTSYRDQCVFNKRKTIFVIQKQKGFRFLLGVSRRLGGCGVEILLCGEFGKVGESIYLLINIGELCDGIRWDMRAYDTNARVTASV